MARNQSAARKQPSRTTARTSTKAAAKQPANRTGGRGKASAGKIEKFKPLTQADINRHRQSAVPMQEVSAEAQRSSREIVRRVNRPLDASNVDLGKTRAVQIPTEGHASAIREQLDKVDGPEALKKAEETAFMEEPLLLVISESDNPNAENPVSIGVNGVMGYVKRGEATWVKRKYVERLARCKSDNFKQNLKERDPEKFNILRLTRGLRYPFTVLEDKNPRGRDWLIKILKEA
jgi:hypothetical protein